MSNSSSSRTSDSKAPLQSVAAASEYVVVKQPSAPLQDLDIPAPLPTAVSIQPGDYLYVHTTAALQKLLRKNANRALVNVATDPVVALLFQMSTKSDFATEPSANEKLVTITIALSGSSSYSAVILHMSPGMSQAPVNAALTELLENPAVVKVVHDLEKTQQLVLSGAGVSSDVNPVNCVDLQQLLALTSNSELAWLSKYFAGADAENAYHSAVARHLQKDLKAWSQPMLAKRLLLYLDYEANKYLECYNCLIRSGGVELVRPPAFSEQQTKGPAPTLQATSPAATPSKVPSRTTSSTNSGSTKTYVGTTAELNGLIQSRGCELFQVSRTPIV
ncbi:hypothetical protein Gpo141_00008342, partial [Globisporangium polare]